MTRVGLWLDQTVHPSAFEFPVLCLVMCDTFGVKGQLDSEVIECGNGRQQLHRHTHSPYWGIIKRKIVLYVHPL